MFTPFCQSWSWLRRGVEHGCAVVRLLLVCVCQHQRRGYHHPEQRSSISTLQNVLFIRKLSGFLVLSKSFIVYTLVKGVTLSGLWPLSPPLASLASVSVLLHQPPSSSTHQPQPGLSLSPLEMSERLTMDQWEPSTGPSSQSEARCGVWQQCVPAPHQLLLCSIPALMSQFESRVQEPETSHLRSS